MPEDLHSGTKARLAQQQDVQTLYAHLLNRVEVTREARFVARKRLMRRSKRAYYLISLLSLFVIVLSILPNIFILTQQQSQTLLAITIVNSVFIIITTLIDAMGDYSLQAHHMRVSGRELSIVFNKLKLAADIEQINKEWIIDQTDHYQEILDKCPLDHADVDYEAVKILKPHLFSHLDKNGSPAIRRLKKAKLRFKVHYVRARWWLPHCVMLIFSFATLALTFTLM